MSIGLASLTVVIMLLPGFAFLFAVYNAGRAERDTTPKNRVMELAGAASIAFGVHGGALMLFSLTHDPYSGDRVALDLITLFGGPHPSGSSIPMLILLDRAPEILIYAFVSTVVAGLLGALLITVIDRGHGPTALFHGWTGPLRVGRYRPFVLVDVVTRITHEKRILMYRGILENLRQDTNHKVDYVVLVGAKRLYLHLDSEQSRIAADHRHVAIPPIMDLGQDASEPWPPRLLIDGEDISNIYFEAVPDLRDRQLPPPPPD